MKNLVLTIALIVTAITALCLLVPALGIIISAIFVIGGMKLYSEKETTTMKVVAISLLVIGAVSALSNLSGFVGLAAIAGAYLLYKKRYGKNVTTSKTNDPFASFEREWSLLTKK